MNEIYTSKFNIHFIILLLVNSKSCFILNILQLHLFNVFLLILIKINYYKNFISLYSSIEKDC